MNTYDFDKTIYNGDSTVDFFKYCLKRHPGIWPKLPRIGWNGLKFVTGRMEKTAFKEVFYTFLTAVPDIDGEVARFWELHEERLFPYYLAQKQATDVIISASPEFLLQPICGKLGVTVMASRVDKHTGKYTGENCWGSEKVLRFRAVYPEAQVEEFYSDSLSDLPMALEAQRAFLVKKDGSLVDWER